MIRFCSLPLLGFGLSDLKGHFPKDDNRLPAVVISGVYCSVNVVLLFLAFVIWWFGAWFEGSVLSTWTATKDGARLWSALLFSGCVLYGLGLRIVLFANPRPLRRASRIVILIGFFRGNEYYRELLENTWRSGMVSFSGTCIPTQMNRVAD